MNLIPFTADSAADALAQIRARLGPDAVVLNVRRLPASGLSRLWSRPKIEVLACVPPKETTPEPAATPAPPTPLLDCLDGALDAALDAPARPPADPGTLLETRRFTMPGPRRGRREGATLLESMGLSALHAARVIEDLNHGHGTTGPENPADELAQYRNYLTAKWREFRQPESGAHVFIGPPGSGKTTALCKWLTQKTLIEGASARVWRLDVPRASAAEALSVHAEILNVPVERAWNPGASWPEEFLFIDVPGCETGDTAGLDELKSLLSTMPGATVSLVLNAAYDCAVLEKQIRAFSTLPVTDLLFTHLDEEPRRGKLWNFVLGTNYSLSFLAAGQNIPGQFLPATPALLFPPAMRGS